MVWAGWTVEESVVLHPWNLPEIHLPSDRENPFTQGVILLQHYQGRCWGAGHRVGLEGCGGLELVEAVHTERAGLGCCGCSESTSEPRIKAFAVSFQHPLLIKLT